MSHPLPQLTTAAGTYSYTYYRTWTWIWGGGITTMVPIGCPQPKYFLHQLLCLHLTSLLLLLWGHWSSWARLPNFILFYSTRPEDRHSIGIMLSHQPVSTSLAAILSLYCSCWPTSTPPAYPNCHHHRLLHHCCLLQSSSSSPPIPSQFCVADSVHATYLYPVLALFLPKYSACSAPSLATQVTFLLSRVQCLHEELYSVGGRSLQLSPKETVE